jgi:hypothetical protein
MDNMVLSISGYNSTAAAALRSTTWSGNNSSGFTALPVDTFLIVQLVQGLALQPEFGQAQ